MSFSDLVIKNQYKSLYDNLIHDFYVPLLKEACHYKRAVGFFSSSVLSLIVPGLTYFVKNGGTIDIIASPRLSEEDIQAMNEGYKKRSTIVTDRLLESLVAEKDELTKNRLNLLANLIAHGVLNIKIATLRTPGIYHEKLGLIEDRTGNTVVFTGSMNETRTAIEYNYETIDVFCSWKKADEDRVADKINSFKKMWHNEDPYLETIEFPQVNKAIIEKYKNTSYEEALEIVAKEQDVCVRKVTSNQNCFVIPANIQLYDYQKEAIENWEKHGYCGIFDMATGTGKTYTALASLASLSQKLDYSLAVVIVVPYRHLVEQWVEDIRLFGVNPIVAYSYSKEHWRKDFRDALNGYNCGAVKNFCVITTNATFAGNDFQSFINKFKKNYCFVVDEAHNLGAHKAIKLLPKKARYRLALSATIERYRDTFGTNELKKYFGEPPCISFTLKEAILKGFLTPYYYYPVIVYLNDDELYEYNELSEKISKVAKYADAEIGQDPVLDMLLIKRARIIAGCQDKVNKLIEVISDYKTEYNILVYCGATKYDRDDISDNDNIKQIDEVNRRLYEDLHMKVRKFTSDEDMKARAEIKEMFINQDIQVITAIKCLDEGVNIPAIKKAFILASSTNPKEYIQRRGRVLRKHPGKEYAEIFDFITLPRRLDDVKYISHEEMQHDLSLIYREFNRMLLFADTARNPSVIDIIKKEIDDEYGL